jgi:hypothetical protein
MRRKILARDLNNHELADWLDELEHFGAKGWARYLEEREIGRDRKKGLKREIRRAAGMIGNVLGEELREEVEGLKSGEKGVRELVDYVVKLEEEIGVLEEVLGRFGLMEAADMRNGSCSCGGLQSPRRTNRGTDSMNSSSPSNRPQNPTPTLRGGGASSPLPSPSPSPSLASDFERIYTSLLSGTPATPSPRTQSWMHIARILQLRNAHLERQLVEYRDLYASTVEDLQWNVDMCAGLEERLRECEDQRIEGVVECGVLRKRLENMEAEEKDKDTNGKEEEEEEEDRREALPHNESKPTSFIFYPRLSLILITGLPAQTLQFAPKTTLPQIHSLLTQISISTNKVLQISPTTKIVRDILAARDALGITLPEILRDDAVMISVPDIDEKVDRTVKIAAWETVDEEESVTSSKKQRSVCSCHLCSEESDPYAPLPGVSVRGGDDDDDDDDDDDYDSGDEDDEVDHEDEAKDPWAMKRKYSKASIRGGGDDDDDGDGSDWEDSADEGEDDVDQEDEARDTWATRRFMFFDDDSDDDVRLAYAIRLSKGINVSPSPLDYSQYMRDMGRRLMEADWDNEAGWDNLDDCDYETLDVAERWNALPAAEQHGFTHYTFPLTAGKPSKDNEWMKGLDSTRIYNEKPVTDVQ